MAPERFITTFFFKRTTFSRWSFGDLLKLIGMIVGRIERKRVCTRTTLNLYLRGDSAYEDISI